MYPAPTLHSAHLHILGRWLTSRRLYLLEFFFRIPLTSGPYTLGLGKSWDRSSVAFCGNVATRTSCSNITVRLFAAKPANSRSHDGLLSPVQQCRQTFPLRFIHIPSTRDTVNTMTHRIWSAT
jgi:hypothetical protein